MTDRGNGLSDDPASEGQVVRRLNWGCGEWVVPGWTNSDIKEAAGVVVCDIREGLPFESDWFDYVVSIHALPELTYDDLVPALTELHRVLRPGGVLRLGLPDLERGYDAYRNGNRQYFQVPDSEMGTLGGKLVAQLLWFGHSRTIFVREFAEELLREARFREVHRVGFGETHSPYPEIVSLDNREEESFFVEAVAAEEGRD